MTRNVKLEGCRCITPRKSVGQNVCIVLRKNIVNHTLVKLYEPNDIANMIGVRMNLLNTKLKLFTAHLKQLSTNSRDDIKEQFEEIRKQFQYANDCQEAALMAFDANVHVGSGVISGCSEKQDWGGCLLMDMIEEENLILVNSSERCTGITTRVDPRNGNGSSIDLVICNVYAWGTLLSMDIDEESKYKPTNYGKITKKTDHNSINIKMSIKRSKVEKPGPFINTKNIGEREVFKSLIRKSGIDELFIKENSDIDAKFSTLMVIWNDAMKEAFRKIKPKRRPTCGIDKTVRDLMKEEKWIRLNVLENPERGRQIAEVTKKIRVQIERNRGIKIETAVGDIQKSKNPQQEIFKIRKMKKQVENIGFPLKDDKGVLQVSKLGIDDVVDKHFRKVFGQNPVPDGLQWKIYWMKVDKVFELISQQPGGKQLEEPTHDEVGNLICDINSRKSVLGEMTGDMVKLVHDPMMKMVFNFVKKCLYEEDIPTGIKLERMALLYKNAGDLADMDNYRGIFLRHILLSLLQKWMYGRAAPILDANGSEFAFGGRTGRSVPEVLLILRLIQDHSHWTGQPLILKFLDVRKFFDTMNFKKCLIEAYKSGINGKLWNMYKAINEFRNCIPYTPLGECKNIEMNEIFVQGSSDAMLMAWNLVDSINKGKSDVYDPVFIVDGIAIPRILFVDDILEMTRSVIDTIINTVSNEVFEKENRFEFKPSKCKMMGINCAEELNITLNGVLLEEVEEHKYIGTIVSKKGRESDFKQRVKDCNGVLNEIVEVCKNSGIGDIRLKFVRMLVEACFKMKFKFGCEVWDPFKKADKEKINRLIPNTIKRVLEVPRSTPSTAIQYEFGIMDLDLEVDMERILLVAKVLDMDDNRVAKKLLSQMLEKNVPGFCHTYQKSREVFGIDLGMLDNVDKRKFMKSRLIDLQKNLLVKRMSTSSKTDKLLLSFSFDGQIKRYLYELPFQEARIIFMFRCRMFPTQNNFPGRWSTKSLCRLCCQLDSDEHLFTCCGYADIVSGSGATFGSAFNVEEISMEELSITAKVLLLIYERLELVNDDKDLVT